MSRKLMPMRGLIRCASLALLAAATCSCGDVVRTGRSSVILVLDSLSPLQSHVASGGADSSSASLEAAMKDVTGPAPTSNNDVTITSYHVEYTRTDGRNQPGVDVPYAFDGAVTAKIFAGAAGAVPFQIVRADAKKEAPLAQLNGSVLVINTQASVTFFGHDTVGNDVSVTGSTEVDFSK
jgi:hypothetical protein